MVNGETGPDLQVVVTVSTVLKTGCGVPCVSTGELM